MSTPLAPLNTGGASPHPSSAVVASHANAWRPSNPLPHRPLLSQSLVPGFATGSDSLFSQQLLHHLPRDLAEKLQEVVKSKDFQHAFQENPSPQPSGSHQGPAQEGSSGASPDGMPNVFSNCRPGVDGDGSRGSTGGKPLVILPSVQIKKIEQDLESRALLV